MPCRDEGMGAWAYGEKVAENDRLTKLLCYACKRLNQQEVEASEAASLQRMLDAWWAQHQIEDEAAQAKASAQRVKEERIAQARSKLTKEERQLLGIR